MFKRSGIFCQVLSTILVILIGLLFTTIPIYAEQPNFSFQSKAALLMEVTTGEIIFEKNSTDELPPASITKIMTLLLIMEALDDGRANLNDIIRVSENAMRMGGSQIYLEVGEEMTLNDLLKSIAIASANDACVAVAEYLYGTEADFVAQMNERARKLGLEHTYFYNTTGLPPSDPQTQGNYTCAHDVAVMSRELLSHREILNWTSIWMDTVRNGEFGLTNTNRLVRHYEGVDGLKTGYTTKAKFCLSATGTRNNLRFLAVVMGAPSSDIRFKEISTMLSYGFNSYVAKEISQKGLVMNTAKVSRGKEDTVQLVATEDFYLPQKKGAETEIMTEVVLHKKIIAPVKAGQILGDLVILKEGQEIGKIPLQANADVERGSIFRIIGQLLKNFLASLINLFR